MSNSIYQGQPVTKKDGTYSGPMYYIVNPSGAVHRVERDHAIKRLKDARFRLATDQEIETWRDTRVQSIKNPCGTPWDPTPDVLVNIPEPIYAEEPKMMATQASRELAEEHGVDLADVIPTGAGGQIIKSDVQRYIENLEG